MGDRGVAGGTRRAQGRAMLARVRSASLRGIEAIAIDVEVDVVSGLPSYHVVGLPTPSVKEGSVRIRAALEAVGQALPQQKITINLAPADVPKAGTAFDLPIAVGVLGADGSIDLSLLDDFLVLGEVGLDGALRPVRGTLAAAILARDLGLRGIIVPAASAGEAAVVDRIEVRCAHHLQEVVAMLTGGPALPRATPRGGPPAPSPIDLADVRGQGLARAALEVAIAGGHNVLFVGPPGIGKSMLARRIPSILPPMSHDEALEVTKIYSSIGAAPAGMVSERPFRAPHHSVSAAALLGGGTVPRPGEITLAHRGVLFLDELPEFQRSTIEALRQPLEEREVVIGRAAATLRFPCSFLFVAAANPCPCGWAGSKLRECTCSTTAIERYRGRLSGPLLDRIDLHIPVPPVALAELRSAEPGESSAAVRARVEAARARQRARLAPWGLATNAEMSSAATRATCALSPAAEAHLGKLVAARRWLSARSIDRIIKVARTVADLADAPQIDRPHLAEAAGYRAFDREGVAPPAARA
jgi:magnesium chelatase family protein